MRTTRILLAFTFGLVMTSSAAAQVAGQPYRISDRELVRLLDRIKSETKSFRSSLKDALNKSRFDRTRREDDINAYVKDFEEQTKRLDDNFDHHRSTTGDVDSVLDRAARIDGFMNRYALMTRVQGDWARLRADLDQLAEAYNVSRRWGSPELPGSPEVGPLPYRLTDKEVEEIIHRIEHQSNVFRKSLDSALDKSRFNGTRREDDINSFVKDFYKETKRLHDHFDSHKSTANDVTSVLDRAAQIDQFMRRNRLRREAQRDWSTLRGNLDELAQVYNVTWRW
jgi:archaellum component FlaC